MNVLERNQITETRDFLKRLAQHLEANAMSGQAGNCMIQFGKLDAILSTEADDAAVSALAPNTPEAS